MYRYLNLDITQLGILLMICGVVCVIMALTRRAYAPRLSFLCGILLLISGGLMWLLPQLSIPKGFLSRLGLLAGGIIFLAIDLVNYYKR